MNKLRFLVTCLLLFSFTIINAQEKYEPWIAYPTASVSDYGVYHFRKSFNLDVPPVKLLIEISADNRYHLFVNGKRISYGPAKGDLETYKYDIVDVGPYLKQGKNTMAVQVYNAGKDKPLALLSVQTALLVRSQDKAFSFLDSDASWKCLKNKAYEPISYQEMLFEKRWVYGFYACGPGDRVEANAYPWGWEEIDYNDSGWENAEVLTFDGSPPWNLVPRNIPFMDSYHENPAAVRLSEGVKVREEFVQGNSSFRVPAYSHVKVLLDYDILTMGYPELRVSGGAGSSIKVNYAEALYEKVNLKAHRDSVQGLKMFGVWDEFHPDGKERLFRPLWKRTFRYVQLEIKTGTDALEILSHSNEYSGYPYPDMSTFSCNEDSLNMIFDISLRTLRMCSGETYYDTPYYEQLSYGGDNRPISAISTYNSTDDRLLREVFRIYPQSLNKETGLFHSAYPSRFEHDQGTWSMAWIQSLYDYYLVRGDLEFVSQFAERMEGVLDFYRRHMDESLGIMGAVRNRNFVDWSITTRNIPRPNEEGEIVHSTILTLYYLHTLDIASKLFLLFNEEEKSQAFASEADHIRSAVYEQCYDKEKELFADHPEDTVFSQQANILAIICNVLPEKEQMDLMNKILEWDGFTEYASSYFSFFLFKALGQTGMKEKFLENLDFWYTYLERGHSTCGETGFASHDRSDCHAWSAHPAYYLMSYVVGIESGSVGFESVRIEPHLGSLIEIDASLPHPLGKITASYRMKKKKLHAVIELPEGLSGEFIYNDEKVHLKEGENKMSF